MLAGAVRGCQTLLQATIVADRWGTTSLGSLQGTFAAIAPAAGPAVAAWLGTYTNMAYVMAAAAATAAVIAAVTLRRPREMHTDVP
ncbi:hypothetical protein [Arthrobacter sp. 24S4-2]|uniref:hypothetical protein n=1 Tax=Arthrobacter sp. 24S4-2 TaxID=2575374 RepID=UPI0020C7B187|nr:hypothetical protein [Arthrobacter sp. 24S4-2]